jgi:hypothetical protein
VSRLGLSPENPSLLGRSAAVPASGSLRLCPFDG